MIRRRPVRRWAAALLNLLFLLAWGEPATLHPCPMHDGVAVAAMGHAPPAADLAHGDHAAQSGHGGEHTQPAPATSHDGGAEHACQCLGECSSASAVALPGSVAVRWQATIRHAAEPPLDAPDMARAASPRLLPFANGPPSLA